MSLNFEWEDMKDSIDLQSVLDELGIRVTNYIKGEHIASCPLPTHPGADANPSFGINEEKLLWNCFSCGEGGSLPTLVAQIVGYEDNDIYSAFEQGMLWLLPYSDLTADTDQDWLAQVGRYLERADSPSKRQRRVTLPSYSDSVINELKSAPVSLFSKWGIREQETIDFFNIKWDERRRKVVKDELYAGPAIIIPHYWQGKLVGYQERWIDEERPKFVKKYTNSTDFPRAETIFGFDFAIKWVRMFNEPVVVVESVMTVVRLAELGIPAVSTFGAQINDTQLRWLSTFPKIIFSADNDPAGKKALKKATEYLSDFTAVEIMPRVPAEKGDLADLDDDEIFYFISKTEPYMPEGFGYLKV